MKHIYCDDKRIHKGRLEYNTQREMRLHPTNQENWPSVGTIASTLAQYCTIYGNTLSQFFWFVGHELV